MIAAWRTMRYQEMKLVEDKSLYEKDSCGNLIKGLSLTLNDQE